MPAKTLRIAGGQLNATVGDFSGNLGKALDCLTWANSINADLLVFPEMFLSGYPIEDLAGDESYVKACQNAMEELAQQTKRCAVIVGGIRLVEDLDSIDALPRHVCNTAAVLAKGKHWGYYDKVLLPTYGVFDEARWFSPGSQPGKVWHIGGVSIGICICEDVWRIDGPLAQQRENGAEIAVVLNASPYQRGKTEMRQKLVIETAVAMNLPILYVNLVGGQDELVFDGASFLVNEKGVVVYQAPSMQEDRFCLEITLPESTKASSTASLVVGKISSSKSAEEEVYQALGLGLKDYVLKNQFERVFIGLSGGIDSALCATLAVDYLGPERVMGVAMPGPYSSPGSITDASALARNLGIRLEEVSIKDSFETCLHSLSKVFDTHSGGVAAENLQARLRGLILMAFSNFWGGIVLSTGNKSELACGYATLYGDMAGGFAPLKDLTKTWVYRLARYRNTLNQVIPLSSLQKPPSAELAPDQKDSDSLPAYEELDPILELYIEDRCSADEIVAQGYDPKLTARVLEMVDRSEYKRRQGAPGIKVSQLAFGRERRLPITRKWHSQPT